MTKIAIAATWLGGALPPYFNLWLASAKANETVDFHLFTDRMELKASGNIHVHYCTLADIKARAEAAMKMRCSLKHPYKICDYRVAYGVMYADILKPYDFWGFCDLDVVFGDLRAFLTEELLSEYDKISNLGHLMLFRNTDRVNRTFMDCRNDMFNTYYEAFHMEANCAFDEKGGITALANAGCYKTYKDYTYTADIFPDSYHFRTFHNLVSDALHLYEYDDGKLYAHVLENGEIRRMEMLYIHLQAREMENRVSDTGHYLVLPSAFVDYMPVTEQLITQENDDSRYSGPLPMTKARKNPPIPLWVRMLKKARRLLYRGTCIQR